MNRFGVYVGICVISLAIGTALHYLGPSEFTGAQSLIGTEKAVQVPQQGTAGEVAYHVVTQGMYAVSIDERKNYAVSSAEEFERLWRMAYGDDAPPIPEINFDTYQVIGVFMGEQSSGGRTISVERIIDDTDTRTVFVSLEKPGEGCMTTQATTRPFQMVQVPWSALNLSRTDVNAARVCP